IRDGHVTGVQTCALPILKRRYQHFCPAARALETIGEKWSLLIVRDLLGGPRRFSDLRRSLATITSKGLSARLRALEADGIVTRRSEERRVGKEGRSGWCA